MKYSAYEEFDEIRRRGKRIRDRHEKRVGQGLSAAAFVVAAVLLGTIGMLGGKGVRGTQTVYGSFLVPAEAGGYVLVAVLAFVLGVALTLMIQKYKEKNGDAVAQPDQDTKEKE